jgi:hypothetical protein
MHLKKFSTRSKQSAQAYIADNSQFAYYHHEVASTRLLFIRNHSQTRTDVAYTLHNWTAFGCLIKRNHDGSTAASGNGIWRNLAKGETKMSYVAFLLSHHYIIRQLPRPTAMVACLRMILMEAHCT